MKHGREWQTLCKLGNSKGGSCENLPHEKVWCSSEGQQAYGIAMHSKISTAHHDSNAWLPYHKVIPLPAPHQRTCCDQKDAQHCLLDGVMLKMGQQPGHTV